MAKVQNSSETEILRRLKVRMIDAEEMERFIELEIV